MHSLQEVEVEELLKQISEGSQEAFNRLYQMYYCFVKHIALQKLGDEMEAEELCHDIFLELIRKAEHYDPARGSVDAWIAVMTRSRAIDRLRKKRRSLAKVLEEKQLHWLAAQEYTPEQTAISRLDDEEVWRALAELPISQRKALYHAYYSNKSQRQMAREWKVPLGTIKSWMRYGLHNLRKKLQKTHAFQLEEGSEAID